ncbi:MAG TPA: hypothetical protein VIL72_14405 [Beijerinckiaceae bacterium]|jgi:hypothetical protein
MFVIVRTFRRVHSMAETARRAETGIGRIVRNTPGFQGYYVFDAGGGVGGSISFFATEGAAIEANEKAIAWIRSSLADQVQGDPDVLLGSVIVALVP